MSDWSIEILPLYRFLAPGPEVFFQRGFGEMVEMAIHAFLLRSAGATVMVDTGLPGDFTALNADVRRRKGEAAGFHAIGERLCERVRNERIDAVVLTSFGPYAAGGLPDLPADTPIHASARGLAELAEPEEAALVHALPRPIADRLRGARAIAGSAEIFPGLMFVECGVHHPASAAIVASTAAGRVAVPDPVFVARNLTDGVALGAAEHAAGWHPLVRLLGSTADAIMPIHEPLPQPIQRDRWHSSLRNPDGPA